MKKLHIVPTFHHDIAYLQPESWYRDRAFAILDKAVALMQEDENYTFTVEQAYFFKDYWQHRPQLQQDLRAFTQQGRLHFAPGFWVVPDMSMPGGESLYMQAILGRRTLAETVGYVPRTAFIADCWGHHAQLPQIMTQCGYDYYAFSRCMRPELDVENFRWRGLDGTCINTHWLSTSYAGVRFPDDEGAVNVEELSWAHASKEGLLQLQRRNYAHCGSEEQIIPAGGDMMMPARTALGMVAGWQQEADMPPVTFSAMENALDSIDFSQKPVYSGEFIAALKGSFATNIDLKQSNREAEGQLYALELLSVLQNEKADLTPQWETVLKEQFHDILCGTICDEALLQARQEFAGVKEQLAEIRARLCGEAEGYINPHNFPVTALVREGDKMLQARLPAFGFARGEELTRQPCPLPAEFENAFYRVRVNEKGFITRLWEKSSGKMLVDDPQIPFGSLQLQADNGDNWVEFEYPWETSHSTYVVNTPDPYDRRGLPTHPNAALAAVGVNAACAYRLGDDGLCIVQKGLLSYWVTEIPFTVTVTLLGDSPRIEYHAEWENPSKRLRLRAAFPALCETGRIRHQVPYGIVSRDEGTQCAYMFTDHASENAGLALLNRGLPQNNVENGVMMVTLMRSVAMEYKCDSFLSYNNGSTFAADYAICPHGEEADDLLWQQALAFNVPPVAAQAAPKGSLAVENAYISALRPVEDGAFLRIYNGTAKAKEAVIRMPEGYRRWALADGLMRPEGETQAVGGEVRIPLRPWGVQGIRFFR